MHVQPEIQKKWDDFVASNPSRHDLAKVISATDSGQSTTLWYAQFHAKKLWMERYGDNAYDLMFLYQNIATGDDKRDAFEKILALDPPPTQQEFQYMLSMCFPKKASSYIEREQLRFEKLARWYLRLHPSCTSLREIIGHKHAMDRAFLDEVCGMLLDHRDADQNDLFHIIKLSERQRDKAWRKFMDEGHFTQWGLCNLLTSGNWSFRSEEVCAAAEQHVDDPVIIEKILSDPYTRDAYASLPFAKRPINTLIGRLVHQSTSKSELSLVLNYPGSAHAEIAATLLLEKHALTQEELDWVLHAAKHISTALVTRCLELTAQIYPHHLKGVTTRGETTDGLQPKTDQLLQQLLKS